MGEHDANTDAVTTVEQPAQPVDADAFRAALGRFTTGVTVVSSDGRDGPLGITVNAFLSLSLSPPLVGVAIDRSAAAHDGLLRAESYGVSVLAHDQVEHSLRHATRDADPSGDWRRLAEVPVLPGALACLACRIVRTVPVGDHTLFVGEVVASEVRDGEPLAYLRGRYGRFAPFSGDS